jgi:hypothetical protein
MNVPRSRTRRPASGLAGINGFPRALTEIVLEIRIGREAKELMIFLEDGQINAEGPAPALLDMDSIREAYLGL